jgi:outer membrane protein OmpA-like peptidoglycan-associated protein
MNKKIVVFAAALAATPTFAQAQEIDAQPGFYIGAGGGITTPLSSPNNSTGVGPVVGGKIGYDFVGPRIDLDVGYGSTPLNVNIPGTAITGKAGQLTGLVNLSYDFFPTSLVTPYIGAGVGIAFIDSNTSLGSTQFAWDALAGVRYNISNAMTVGIEARYLGTTSPSVTVGGQTFSSPNQNLLVLAGVAWKFGQPAPAPPPAPPAPQATSFMVFFDWDRSNLSQQALATIGQAAQAFKTKGSARITATGHTDTSGPENYNMALSLRRANAVKDALVRNGVPATAIAVVGRGEQGLLVPTPDGVREPQNRRVEIVLQ